MKFQLVVIFVTISSTFSAPTPQGFDLNSFNFQFFDEDNVAQGRLPPQGFQPHREVSVRQAEPAAVPNGAEVVRQFYDLDDLHYKYTYELSDGTIKSEEGTYKDVPGEDGNVIKVLVVSGAYSFVGPDNEVYWTKYTADENGYKPVTGKGDGGIQPGEDAQVDPNLSTH